MNMHGSIQIQVVKLILLVRKIPMLGVFTTCMVTSGNGFRINGMKTTIVQLLIAVHAKSKMSQTE